MSRAGEVAAKLARVRGWLDDSGYDTALFSTQPGGRPAILPISKPLATPDA